MFSENDPSLASDTQWESSVRESGFNEAEVVRLANGLMAMSENAPRELRRRAVESFSEGQFNDAELLLLAAIYGADVQKASELFVNSAYNLLTKVRRYRDQERHPGK